MEPQIVETSSRPVIDYLGLALQVRNLPMHQKLWFFWYFNVLQIPPTDSRFKESRFLGHYTVNAITTNTHTLRFYIEPLLGGQTWDLGEPFFMAKLRVTTQDDEQLPENTEASTINMTLFSALKTFKLYVNE